jgi:hypothetical protein
VGTPSIAGLAPSSPGGVCPFEELVGLGLDGRDGSVAGHEPGRRLVLLGDGDDGSGEFSGIAWLLAVHSLPGRLSGGGALGVVVDGQLGPGGGGVYQEFGAEEPRLGACVPGVRVACASVCGAALLTPDGEPGLRLPKIATDPRTVGTRNHRQSPAANTGMNHRPGLRPGGIRPNQVMASPSQENLTAQQHDEQIVATLPAEFDAMTSTGEQGTAPIQAVLALYAAIRDSRIADVLPLVDPRVECLPMVRPGLSAHYGHDGMADLARDMHAVYGRYQVEIPEITEQDGPQVTVRAVIVPESGHGQPVPVTSVYTFRSGLIATIESFPPD